MASPQPISRFSNLELSREIAPLQQSAEELKSERHYLADAQAAFESGQFEQGLRAFSKVLEFNPRNPLAWSGQVRMLIELGEFREAKLWADKALEQFPRDPELLAAKAVALARTGDFKAALAFSDASFEERGDTPYVWLARADVLLARREKRADYCFEKARLLAPDNWFFLWLASRIQLYYLKFALALKLAQQALAADASRSVVWLQIGQCQSQLGLVSQAQTSCRTALELDASCRAAELTLLRLERTTWPAMVRGFWHRFFIR